MHSVKNILKIIFSVDYNYDLFVGNRISNRSYFIRFLFFGFYEFLNFGHELFYKSNVITSREPKIVWGFIENHELEYLFFKVGLILSLLGLYHSSSRSNVPFLNLILSVFHSALFRSLFVAFSVAILSAIPLGLYDKKYFWIGAYGAILSFNICFYLTCRQKLKASF